LTDDNKIMDLAKGIIKKEELIKFYEEHSLKVRKK